jgi:hypothetical protein
LTTTKTTIINLNGYGDSSCDLLYFNPSEHDIKKAQQQLICVIKILSDKECVVSVVQIKFNNPRLRNPLTVIEVLEILQLLYISFEPSDANYCILSTVRSRPMNRQVSEIKFDFSYVE